MEKSRNNISIPIQLCSPDFRFYLANEEKLPIEKKWNAEGGNNYTFFSEKLLNHIRAGHNYGIVTGINNLIILDFDNREYYEKIVHKLPPTFTILSASRRLPHLYYFLEEGEKMFKKMSIRDSKDKTLLDIQAHRSGIICPGSVVKRKYYIVARDTDIAVITMKELKKAIVGFRPVMPSISKGNNDSKEYDYAENLKLFVQIMKILKIEQTKFCQYKCPFHDMNGIGNLHVYPNGNVYCFHENKGYNIFRFAYKVCDLNKDNKAKMLIQSLELTSAYMGRVFPGADRK